MLRIALIEDDSHFAASLEECLKLQPNMNLILKSPSVETFFENLPPRLTIDLLLLDIDLPGQSGVQGIPALRRRFPDAEIIMLTHSEDSNAMLQSFHHGANGYLNKDFNIFNLPKMLNSLSSGVALISPLMARKLIQHFQPQAQNNPDILNPKEIQILRLFEQSYSYEETASLLELTLDGVRYHVRNIYKKLNVNNKLDAIKTSKDRL